MELRGDIAGHRSDIKYDFRRSIEKDTWKKVRGTWIRAPGQSTVDTDDTHNSDEDLSPTYNHIYAVDAPGPNIHGPLRQRDDEASEVMYFANFTEWVEVQIGSGAWTEASNRFVWHSITTLEKVRGRWQRKPDGINLIEAGPSPISEPVL